MSTDRRPRSPGLRLGALFLLLLAATGAVVAVARWFRPGGPSGLDPDARPRPVAARGELSALEQTNVAVYAAAAPSVVHVTNLTAASGGLFDLDVRQIPKGVGSGFVWDEEGHIVTNHHVVQGAAVARVTLADHSTYDTRIAWADPDRDIAVLAIRAPRGKLRPIPLGSSHDLRVGQSTYAIGNPFGLDQTMTAGIVSALDRQIKAANGRPIRGAIQTSAAINPGNSGGPLLDSAGRLIGMNTAILSPSGTFAGIGFAIPVDEINRIVPQLIRHGRVARPQLGVQVAADQLARQLGVRSGALVLQVSPGSAAAEAGVRGTRRDDEGRVLLGDVIVGLGGHSIDTVADLHAALDRVESGRAVAVTVLRGGERQELSATL